MSHYFYLPFIILLFFSDTLKAQMLGSVTSKRKEYEQIRKSSIGLLPHKQMYLMPISHNWLTHNDIYEGFGESEENEGDIYRSSEAEFQISFAVPVVKGIGGKDWDVMVAYTHQAFWQVYNPGWSRPFRETNYMPELFSRYLYKHPKEFASIKLHGVDAGYIHQSNGQVHQLSRSWDRLFVRGLFEFKGLYAQVSVWHRIRESKKIDDNRDITKFMGYGEVELTKSFNKHTFHVKGPIFSKYLGYDVKYSYPLSEGIRWFVNYRSGYGQSLIEYDRQTQRIGAGFMLDHVIY